MVTRWHIRLSLFALAVVGLAVPLAAVPAAEGDAIQVSLESFKFKVPDDQADLFGYNEGEGKLFFYTNGTGEATVKLPAEGEYEITIEASCDPALNERAKFRVTLDDQPVGEETLLTDDFEKAYKLTFKAEAGERKLGIAFTNDVYEEGVHDRNLYVHGVTLRKK